MSSLFLTLADTQTGEDLRKFNEFLSSWPVALVFAALYGLLAVFVFVRVSRDFDDAPAVRRARALVVALGVFLLLVIILPGFFGGVSVPVPVKLIAVLWLFAAWLYYIVRFMTAQRSGPADPEAQRRGRALEQTLAPMADDAARRPAGPAPGA
jgi:hypothetical protein